MSGTTYTAGSSSSPRPVPKVTKVDRVFLQSNQKLAQPQTHSHSPPSLELTAHHFVLRFPASTEEPFTIPYTLINSLVRLPSLPTHDRQTRIYPLGVRLRTFQIYALGFDSEALATDVFETVKSYAVLRSPEQLYAFHRQPGVPPSQSSSSSSQSGWKFYDPKKEFTRQGIGSRTKAWRFTDLNQTYSFSPTYPNQLVVPSRISDQTLNYAAKYRSKARIPALTYLHWANYGSITRCSQPMVGLKGNRSVQDEKLIEAIFSSHIFADPNSKAAQAAAAASAAASQSGGVAALGPSAGMVIYGATSTNLIIDARPTTNAMANVAKGAGSENMEHYRGCKKAYLGIDNIHVMRDSLHKLSEALKEAEPPLSFPALAENSANLLDRAATLNASRLAAVGGGGGGANGNVYATYRGRPGGGNSAAYHSGGIPAPAKPLDTYALKRSNWLKHIAALMEGTMMIVRNVHINSSHALIHCSDGWDRTTQLAALAQICLDPYFRTLDGMAVLIEKDWLSFGHRFEDRSGHLGHPSRFVTDPGHGEPYAAEEWDQDGNEINGNGGGGGESEGFEAQAAVNAIWGFTKQLTAGFGGGGGSGGGAASATNLREISPVFHQFLDCVWQLMRQFPNRFEYNVAFLVELHAQVYSCEYGTFLLNSERERHALGMDDGKVVSLEEKTPSLWDDLLGGGAGDGQRRKRWVNEKYEPSLDAPTRPFASSSSEAEKADPAVADEKKETDASSSTTASDISSASASASASASSPNPTKFGDMGVLLANPREVRFFADLFRRDEREMNALINAEAVERARYAQRLADAAAGAMSQKTAAAAALESPGVGVGVGAVPVPVAVAVEAGSADPGRDPVAAAAFASASSTSLSSSSGAGAGVGGTETAASSPAAGRAGVVDLGTTMSASRIDGARLGYQARVPRQPAATMPRSGSGALALGVGGGAQPPPASVSAGAAAGVHRPGAVASATPGGESGMDDAGARMKNLFMGGWGKIQNVIASAGQAAASAPPSGPAPGTAGWQSQPNIPPHPQAQAQAQGRRQGSENPWAASVVEPSARSAGFELGSSDLSEWDRSADSHSASGGSSGLELRQGREKHGALPSLPTPPPPPAKDDGRLKEGQPGYISQTQSNTLTGNPWAAGGSASASRSAGHTVRLEDVFGAEQARNQQARSGGPTGAGAGAGAGLWASSAEQQGGGRGERKRSPSPAVVGQGQHLSSTTGGASTAAAPMGSSSSYPPPPPPPASSGPPTPSSGVEYDPLGVGAL
ncbi:unnamed protein product [Tilletia laevis]|uniref:Myotubularin phosphatase domain-containing protein n=3 Tax=Tilletia TaxID=13289 RepID=A0A8X7MZZ7_9BASI|nr:hypothetical protein CF336_g3236 [Tilletia laevis]KAE8204916.1 hypothetical protein CF328_g807 [Tilletia controversa]KAE8265005.1 hypothetical protein A4X03_0g555 [Tilletia caries]KAE8205287.1 hypothetical protein CF335_g2354 [Tilletia laevis]KAE8255107.1 hypothetical protein A4X06_0g590 [Tilletia controversa]